MEERGIQHTAKFFQQAIVNECNRHEDDKQEQRLAKTLSRLEKTVKRVSDSNRATCALLVEFFRSHWLSTGAPHQVDLRIKQLMQQAADDFAGKGGFLDNILADEAQPQA
jgi:hypothetical protein